MIKGASALWTLAGRDIKGCNMFLHSNPRRICLPGTGLAALPNYLGTVVVYGEWRRAAAIGWAATIFMRH